MLPRESFYQRWKSLGFVFAIVLLASLFHPYKHHPAIYSDGVGYHVWTRAILDGDLSFRRYADREEYRMPLGDTTRQVYQNKYPPGLALLRLPVMAFVVDRKHDYPLISTAEHVASMILGALALIVTCFFCLQVCRLLSIPSAASHTALVTVVFGTGLFHYGTYDACYSHIYSALVGSFMLWLGVRTLVEGWANLPGLATGVGCFFLIEIRNTNVLLLSGLVAGYLAGRIAAATWEWPGIRRDLAAVVCGAGAAAILQIGYNYYATGGFVLSSYQGEHFVWNRPMQLAVLFSYERGIFRYYPIVAVLLLAGLAVRATRLWTALFGVVLLGYVTLYGFWWCWTLGGGFGYRGVVEMLPAGTVVLAAALPRHAPRAQTFIRACAWICVLVTLELLVGHWTWRLAQESGTGAVYWQHVLGRQSILRFLY